MPDVCCGLDKWQLLGLRVLSLTAVYPEGLGSVDLILLLDTLGAGPWRICARVRARACTHTHPVHTHVSHESLSLSFLRGLGVIKSPV